MDFKICSILILIFSMCKLAFGIGDVFSWFNNKYCGVYECCTNKQVPYNLSSLKTMFRKELYGQHIATSVILDVIYAHMKATNHKKPLVLSFHGSNGVGKTYTTRMIAKALFEKGESSRYFHFYYGKDSFPLDEKISEYQVQLKYEIQKAIDSCERSLFVFDGVDYMPPNILDALMPFVDCPSCGSKTKKNKSIFIFLTNTGSQAIENQLLKKMSEGTKRVSTNLKDFEKIIISEALNFKGGLFESLLIKSETIDIHVPFLPLEKRHVQHCIENAFQELNVTSTEDLIDEVFQDIRFGPEPENLFSNSGCKKVSTIVGRIAARFLPDYEDINENDNRSEL